MGKCFQLTMAVLFFQRQDPVLKRKLPRLYDWWIQQCSAPPVA